MEPIVLTGRTLTEKQFHQIVRDSTPVEIAPDAYKRLEESRKLLYALADSETRIYGLNVGVGWNKDAAVLAEHYEAYNRKLIYSHCVGLPPYAKEQDVRAALLARLNTLLQGATGVNPEIPKFYAELLNRKIHPLIPERGSVGQTDIGLMSFVGLTVLGEGQVYYRGEVTEAKAALEAEGLQAIMELGPKDGLSIVSTNALGLGQGILVLKEMEKLLDAADLIYCCALEALNGNMSPFDQRALRQKGDKGSIKTGITLRKYLVGSFLHRPDETRHLQDPLCFRDTVHIHGATRELIAYTKERLLRALNAGEDNPCLLPDEGRSIPTANYDPINWVLGLEGLATAIAHVAHAAGHRIVKLANPAFTGLPRFLAPDGALGFATLQKTYTASYAKIRHLANPASLDTFALAGQLEDKATNAPYVVHRLRDMLDALREMLAIELLHAAQGQDFRLEDSRTLGKHTGLAHKKVRQVVPFLEADRVLAHAVTALQDMLKGEWMGK